MQLRTAIGLLRKWLWLLLLGAGLAGGAALLWQHTQPARYEARVIIAVGSTLENPSPDTSFITTGANLAPTYVILATTHEVLNAAIAAGGYEISRDELEKMLSVHVIPDTALVEIVVTYTDPRLATDIANEIARQLILKSPSYLTDEEQAQLEMAHREIESLSAELAQARDELHELDTDLIAARNTEEITRLRDHRYTLASIINEKSSIIAEFTATTAGFRQRSNSLHIVETALPPTAPIGIGPMLATGAGAVLGAAVFAGLALLIEYFDDTIPSATEANRLLMLPILGTISRFGRRRASYKTRLIAFRDPDASATEGYRALRTNLLFLSNGAANATSYVITSPGKGEGKTVTASNLAVTIALAGLRVLLIDADLRSPTLHRVFGLDNSVGLSTLALSLPVSPKPGSDGLSQAHQRLEEVIQKTDVPGLRVITSGPPPANPAELLGSEAMRQWVCQMKSMPDVDIVLFDTPPLLSVTDGAALAVSAGLPVLLVIHAQHTRSGAATKAKEQLDVLGTRVLGVVLNAASPADNKYYYSRYGS